MSIMSTATETFTFETQAKQILELMTHSVYSNREIFLRELISNASDALDKRRFEAIENKDLLPENEELSIWVEADKDTRTLTLRDNGIGMSREEVITNIGTIARSGTKEFLSALKDNKDAIGSPDLIGQFGVGFYSIFMVADHAELITRRAGEETATKWVSTGDGTYSIEASEKAAVGTTISMKLKETDEEDGQKDFATEYVIREIVKRYSDFVSYPIKMDVEREEQERDEEGQVVEGGESKTVVSEETLNSMKALWMRDKSEVEDSEYNEFYRHISHDWNEPVSTITLKAEGTYEYRALLFLPSKAPMNLFHQDFKTGVKLYVRRVFIMDECSELLPEYLRFVKGVVDAEDLNLNISREILQQDRQVKTIRKRLVKKVLDSLKDLKKNDAETYEKFWNEFGQVLKEGLYSDMDNRETLLGLMLASTTDDASMTSLADYSDRMKEGQDSIYYLTGKNLASIENSPHLESFKDKGYEVLFFTDPVDEVWLERAPAYEDLNFASISKGEVDLGTEEEKEKAREDLKKSEENFKSLLEKLQALLDNEVKEVRLTNRMTSSPACLVVDQDDMSPQMAQLMSAMGQGVPTSKRILEVNPNHPILEKLRGKVDENAEDPAIGEYAQLLHGQALLAEGGTLNDPTAFTKLVSNLMVRAL
jgi:molecular chaperone HtpG